MAIRPGAGTLDNLPQAVMRPHYRRASLSAGIVHIGPGNFHRAHQAWYLHRLMQDGRAQDWAIIGAGVRPFDAARRHTLKAQDCLSTLIELDPVRMRAEITGAMIDYLPVETHHRALVARVAQADIRIVSLTITEGGYFRNPATGAFDARHRDIRHDARNPCHPRTVFGALVAALKLRRDRGIGPLTLLCCDNLEAGGAVLRTSVVSLAQLCDPALADWIATHCTFPCTMVDCIVPATGPREQALAREFGIDDCIPVAHENYRQWVIEDDFCQGRPEWDRVGACFSADVAGHEAQKIRILNAGHQILANTGEILHINTIAGAMAHDAISALFGKIQMQEITPHIVPVAGVKPARYVDLVARRFSNPAILDTTRRVAFDGAARHAGFILPTIRDALGKAMPVTGLALAEAAWARMCQGTREDGTRIEPNDPLWNDLTAAAQRARSEPHAWLAMRHIYGDLGDNPRFAADFARALRMIWAHGLEAAIHDYIRR